MQQWAKGAPWYCNVISCSHIEKVQLLNQLHVMHDITVNETPIFTLSSDSDPEVCAGELVTLTANGNADYTYAWSGIGLNITTGESVVINTSKFKFRS